MPGLAVPIGVHGCSATRRRVKLPVLVGLRTGHSGGTRVLPLVASIEPRIRDNIYCCEFAPARRAISRSTPMVTESPTGRTIPSWPFWDYRQKPTTGRDLTPPLLVRGLPVRDRVNRPTSIYLQVPARILHRGEGPRLRPTPDTNR